MKCLILAFNASQSPAKVTSHYFAEYLLSVGYKVLYVSDAISPFHLLKIDLFRENLNKIITTLTVPIDYGMDFIGIIPFTWIPIRNNFPFNLGLSIEIHLWFVSSYFRSIIAKFLGADLLFDLIWINNPKYYQIAQKNQCKKLVYSIEDDLFEYPNIPQSLQKNHQKLLQIADIVTVTSEPLFNQVKPLLKIDSKLILLRNGVNFKQFERADSLYLESDLEFKSIPKPRIIYIGTISHRLDFDLLSDVARSLPNCSFAIVGPSDVSLEKLKKIPNIYFLGAKSHDIIQNYLQAAEIGIIPFVRTKLIESVNPIKLYEYMAAGLPVVSTTWQEIESLNSPVLLAKNSDEFIEHISNLLSDPNIFDKQLLLNFAKSNSWESRFIELIQVLELGDKIKQ